MCANRMLSPSVLIGPREDESVSVMRLEKKSSIHNLTECVCNAMQHGKCSPCSFVFFLKNFQKKINKSIYGPPVWEVDVTCVPVRHFPMDVLMMEFCQGN